MGYVAIKKNQFNWSDYLECLKEINLKIKSSFQVFQHPNALPTSSIPSVSVAHTALVSHTHVVQMPPLVGPLSVCQPVVHRLLSVTTVSA